MEGGGEVTREKTRIYVGGLGGGVTENDLRKTFSALGEVVAVDVVRTKGRSFAYLDFLPSSDKSLPKLFSTYNGCMWKGGKLRLEKAKEHYLLRLKHEWQEESENASKASDSCNADATKIHSTLEKPTKPSVADKTQINIFFPKLGKVKSLAQVGIGKHKYSFQRIQVPSTPTHFCDCEEHSLAFQPPSKRQSSEIDNASYGINEQELNIMNSVMNKIFERANPSSGKSESTNGKDEFVAVENDEEDNLTDEDNLIINVANNRKNDSMDLLGEMRTMMANQELLAKKLTTSTEKSKSQNKTVALTKKRQSPHSEEIDYNHTPIPKTSRNCKPRLDTNKDSKIEVESGTKQLGSNSLRSLKSTWKDLIGQKRDKSFSISDFIASIPQRKEEEEFKRKSEDDKSRPTLDINKESATEIGISAPDIIANDCQQKEEEPKADNLDLPLTTIGQQLSISDVVAGGFDQKEEELTDDLDCNLEKLENDQDLKKLNADSPVKNDQDLIRTARGEFWRHKSSWTQLISPANHTSFSISHIVPDISFEKDEQVDTFVSQPANKNLHDLPTGRKEINSSPVKKNVSEKKRILSLGNLESDETCPFMRTEESIKEWKKAKASLSGSVNKKKRLVNESA